MSRYGEHLQNQLKLIITKFLLLMESGGPRVEITSQWRHYSCFVLLKLRKNKKHKLSLLKSGFNITNEFDILYFEGYLDTLSALETLSSNWWGTFVFLRLMQLSLGWFIMPGVDIFDGVRIILLFAIGLKLNLTPLLLVSEFFMFLVFSLTCLIYLS